ncbi:DNA primase [Desulfonauticus submarinus]|uniref:DNA primase n=1 Tax=Desulfonauticus submarinus TaxID=206665 RepID=A0A1H0G2J9_9BACT|nr:DNA primase [Desulfonauticus submarinus]SDO01148.1 DNA primase [Desulfonauticus submarinus]
MDLEEIISEIKDRLNIVDIVSRYVELRQVGSRFVAPCPFHQETKPSFNVNPEKGFFYCFGCQAAGDVIHFYQRINGLEFKEALEDLAKEAGISLDKKEFGKPSVKKIFLYLHKLAVDFFKKNLSSDSGKKARDYLKRRNISALISSNFELGYSLNSWHSLEEFFRKKGITIEDAIKCGLIIRNEKGHCYDRFRDRLMFPILDYQGRVVAFGARALGDEEPKYLNSSESLIYKKSEHLYGLYQAKQHIVKEKSVLLTEGYIDVLSLVEAGFKNSCAILGTSLTKEQIFRLSQLTSKIILLLDGDAAGQKAALRSAEMILSQGLDCQVAILPNGEDADSFLKKFGSKDLTYILKNAEEGLAYCLKMVRKNKSPKEQILWVENFLDKISDFKLKSFYLPKIAYGLGLSESELRQGLKNVSQTQTIRDSVFSNWDKDVLCIAIFSPQDAKILDQEGIKHFLHTRQAQELWDKLIREEDVNFFTEEERSFFIQVKLYKEKQFQINRESILQEVKQRLETKKKCLNRQNLLLALKKAQNRGDQQEVKRILSLLQKKFN